MFKVGDKVWAKTNRYSMTSYHRPCEVISVDKLHLGRVVVRIAKTGGGYEVDTCEFEHIPKGAMFENGRVFCTKLNGIVQIYNISDIVRSDNFYV